MCELVSQTENDSPWREPPPWHLGLPHDWSFSKKTTSSSELFESQRFGSDLSSSQDCFQIITVRIVSYPITKQQDNSHIILQVEVLFDERKFMMLLFAVKAFHFSRLAGVLG